MIGKVARTRTHLNPKGTVIVKGELWDAEAIEGHIERDQAVQIVAVDGFLLRVEQGAQE